MEGEVTYPNRSIPRQFFRIASTMALVLCMCESMHASLKRCDIPSLPSKVRSVLASSYQTWTPVTLDQLSSSDQEIWKERSIENCPGIVSGRFTGGTQEFVVSLIRRDGDKLYQQVVLFQASNPSRPFILLAPTEVATISVISKVPPGEYKPAEGEKRITVRFDSVALTALEKGTIQYYWNGRRFLSIITSE